ncbi:MAG: hypothetical protein JXQ90_05440 [Cyclobacteriaceae bacterium]
MKSYLNSVMMKKVNLKYSFIYIGIVLMSFSALSQETVIIVNNDNPVETMKSIEVKLYYMRKVKQVWPDLGEQIVPVGSSVDSPARKLFLSKIMKLSSKQLDAYFKQRQFANGEALPPALGSDEEIIKYVSENKGAIGYVSQAAFSASGGVVKSVLSQ